ncbi:hypothetical protein Tco_0623700, partial [Tanacetum coccineum]
MAAALEDKMTLTFRNEMNEKEKDDEVRESVFEEILIDKEEFFFHILL